MLKWAGASLLGILALCLVFLATIDHKWPLVSTFEGRDSQNREDQCEALHVDSVVLEPQNTWSNLGYLFAGLLVVYRSRTLRGIGVGALLCVTGITSGLYHAVPVDRTLQTLDVASIYWLLLALIGYGILSLEIHFHALGREPLVEKLLIAVALVAGAIVAVAGLLDSTIAVLILVAGLLVLVGVGFFPPSRQITPLTYREITGYLMGMLMLGIFAAVCRLGDGEGRVLCDPHGPIQFHALWHLFSAALLLVAYDYFTRVADLPGERILAD
jgi:hypothetical protein